MKIERFNEDFNIKDEVYKKYNNKISYITKKTGGLAVADHSQKLFNNLEDAIKEYNELKRTDKTDSNRTYIYIIKKELSIIPEEEIDFINATNNYNL